MQDILIFNKHLRADFLKASHHGQWGKDDAVLRSFMARVGDNTAYIITNGNPQKINSLYLGNNRVFVTGRDGFVKIVKKSKSLTGTR